MVPAQSYLEVENDGPDEAQYNGGLAIRYI